MDQPTMFNSSDDDDDEGDDGAGAHGPDLDPGYSPVATDAQTDTRNQLPPMVHLQEFFCPVCGPVRLRPSEVAVLNHYAFNRLRYVYQLGQTSLVYPGTTHTRFEHALGTLHVAEMMIASLNRNTVNETLNHPQGDWVADAPLGPAEVAFTRLAALLHDVGHIPAGHTFEDELGLLKPHDSDERLRMVLDKDSWLEESEKPLREVIDQEYRDLSFQTGLGSATDALLALISRDRPQEHPAANQTGFRVGVCRSIVSDTVCADLLDYLHRDWLHLGKTRHFDNRIFDYMELRKRPGRAGQDESVVVVNVRARDQLRFDAVTAILDMLESRYQLFEIALFHRTKLTATAMLERAVAELADSKGTARDLWLGGLLPQLLECDDVEMLDLLRKLAMEAAGQKRPGREHDRLDAAARILRDLRMRRLYKKLHHVTEPELGDPTAAEVQTLYEGGGLELDDKREVAQRRLHAVRLLEEDFGLPPCSIVMYCPPRKMNSKLAEVQVLLNQQVITLDRHEAGAGRNSLTAGMLAAQKARFERLWRVQFAVRKDVRDRMQASGVFGLLVDAIDLLVLGRTPRPGDGLYEGAFRLATELGGREWASPLKNRRLVEVGAYNRSARYVGEYPTRALSLRQFIGDE